MNDLDRMIEALTSLIDAADAVVGSWESGDLAGAVNNLEACADDARELMAAI